MKLLKSINQNVVARAKQVVEDAAAGAVAASGVAGGMMPLFSMMVQRNKPAVVPVEEIKYEQPKKKSGLGLSEAYRIISEEMTDGSATGTEGAEGSNFDTSEVISKLKGLESKEKADYRDTTTFGLEDSDGQIVRVILKNDQAQDFEKSLQAFMSDQDEDEQMPEIAEILFKLKDRFDLVDVIWPEIQEDEEAEDVQLQGGNVAGDGTDPNAAPTDPNADPNAPVDPNADPSLDAGAPDMGGGEADSASLLTQVIDMMKADADARKADARAREAEAKVREAEAIAAQSDVKVKQAEQQLDMEDYEKGQKASEKETKRLAQLSKWKAQMSREHGIDDDPSEDDIDSSFANPPAEGGDVENEERSYRRPQKVDYQNPRKATQIKGRVHPHDVAAFILSRVKS